MTCKPLKALDPEPGTASGNGTRTRRLQVALDSMARAVVARSPGVGLVDASSVLIGFEYFAADKRHYSSTGACTLANAALNEMMMA